MMESNRKLSIVHINTHDVAGGAAKVAWRLAQSQRNAGHDPKILVSEKERDWDYTFSFPVERNRHLDVVCRQQGLVYYEFQGSHKLVDNPLIRSADILHLHNLHGGYFNPYSLSAISHLKPTIWTLHDMQSVTGHCAHSFGCQKWQNGCGKCPDLSIYPELLIDSSAKLWRDKKQIYDHSHLMIVTPSLWLKNIVERSNLRNHPIELIYNGVNTGIFKPYDKQQSKREFGIPTDKLVIGAVAHLGALENPWKGGRYTQAVFKALPGKLTDYVFVNIGSDRKSDDPRIINIPHIDNERKLAHAYSMLDIFLYTPAADNCPLVVLEALACGVPMVTFNVGGVPELVQDGLDGYVTPYKDISKLVQALLKLATHPELRAEFGRNARAEAVKKFEHKIIARQYQELYERYLRECKSTPRQTKSFSLSEVPEVIINQAFIKAENSKKISADNTEKQSETKNRPDFGVQKKLGLTVATSIAPKGLDKQINAIKSWTKLGFSVISVNCAEEIDILQERFPKVKFIQAKRDGRNILGKPVVYLDDIFEYFRKENCEICGILNSDIYLSGDENIISFIQNEIKNSLLYGSRIDVKSLKNLEGEFYEDGFDFFFFPKTVISCFPESDFCMGMPWWDYWMALMPVLEGFQIKRLVSPFAYHIKHTTQWNDKQWKFFARKFFGYLGKKIDENFNLDPSGNPWALLGKVFSAYHHYYLKVKGLVDKNKITIGIIPPCILEFLKMKSLQINHTHSRSITTQTTNYLPGSKDDWVSKKTIPIVFLHHGNNYYLEYALIQARISNPRSDIFLIGDDDNDQYKFVIHKNLTDYNDEALEFAKIYKHMSPNQPEHELFCIQRWYILKQFMKSQGIEKCFHMESDVLLYADITQERQKYSRYDLTLHGGSVGHNSFINNPDVLMRLCDLINEFYNDPQLLNYLKILHEYRMKNFSCGISDMVFFNEYQKKYPDKIGEMKQVVEKFTYDGNINHADGFEISDEIKEVHWINDIPFGRKVDSGELVGFNTLHFQDNAKTQMAHFVRTKKALEKFLTALKEERVEEAVVSNFGLALERLGQKVDAINVYKTYLQSNSDDRQIQNRLLELEKSWANPAESKQPGKLVIATSIAPKNIKRQAKAIESWRKLGFDVVSINCAEEIEILQGELPDVNFICAKRDGRDVFGKPVIYLDDFIEYFQRNDFELCGIVNSDIFLIADEGIVSFLKDETKNDLVYGSRINVDSLEDLDAEFFNEGFDYFFFNSSLLSRFPKSEFCIGMPWWDYWMPLMLILEGVKAKKLVSPFAYHIKHSYRWNKKHGTLLAKECFKRLHKKINDNFNADPDTNPWAFLGRMLFTYHRKHLEKNNIADDGKMDSEPFYYCIFDFLKQKSSHISYVNSKSKMLKNLSPEKEKDILVHQNELRPQSPDYLRAEYDISIVLCTRDRAELLDKMLTSLKEAAKSVAYEVIVIEGDSADNTLDILRKHHITKVYNELEWLGPGSHSWPQLYNFGFSKASGKWAMYASDDIVFSKEAISWAYRALSKQDDKVAGGIFFYKNTYPTNPEWSNYGIDFTYGSKLLMNYGLVRLDCFREVGGLDEGYKFYCADTDFCFKLYKEGWQLIPLLESFVAHNNVFDAQKKANYLASDKDIQLLLQRWGHFVPTEIPSPRRLIWQDKFLGIINLSAELEKVDSGIESFWHGLAYFQRGNFQLAEKKFVQAVELQYRHWQILWYLAVAAYQCRHTELAAKTATAVIGLKPDFIEAKNLLEKLACKTDQHKKVTEEPLQHYSAFTSQCSTNMAR